MKTMSFARTTSDVPSSGRVTRRDPVTARLATEPGRCTPSWFLLGDGACCDGLNHISGVSDLDLAGLGLLGHGDGQGEHPILVGGAEVVTVETLAEEQLAAELTLG